MASRYWVGGSSTWDATAGTKWATTSGGAGGAAVPTAADDVFLDAASGAVTVTVSGAMVCKDFVCTGFTGTFALITSAANRLQVAGNLTLASTMTFTFSGGAPIWMVGTGSYVMTFAGKQVGDFRFGPSGEQGTWTLADAMNVGGTITHTAGTFATAGFSLTSGTFGSSGSNTRTLSFGSSTVTLTSNGNPILDMSTATNLTVTANTATINLSSSGSGVNTGGLASMGGASLTHTGQAFTWNSTAVWANVTLIGDASKVAGVTMTSAMTVTGTLTLTGNSVTNRLFVGSNTLGTTRTITAAAVSLTNVDFTDIAGLNLPAWSLGGTGGNLLSAQDSSFESAGVGGWTGGGGTLARTTSVASDGSAALQATSTAGGTVQVLADIARVAVTAGVTYQVLAQLRAATTGRTVTAQLNWYTSGGVYITTTTAGTAVDNASGWTQLSVRATAPATAASLRVIFEVASTASGEVHYLDAIALQNASGTWTGSSLGDALGNTGITFDTSTTCYAAMPGNWSTLLWLTTTAPTWTVGGSGGNLLTAAASSFEDGTTGGWAFPAHSTASNDATTASDGTKSMRLTATDNLDVNNASPNTTVTAGLTYSGQLEVKCSAARNGHLRVMFYNSGGGLISSVSGTDTTLSSAWQRLTISAVAPAGTTTMALGFQSASGVTGDIYNIDKAGIFAVTPARVPLPQDDVVFDANSAPGSYTMDMPRAGRDVNCTGFTRTLLNGSAAVTTYGSRTYSAAMSITSTASWTLAGRGSHTITSAGQLVNVLPTINTFGGTYTLADAIQNGNQTQGVIVTSGTFDSAGFSMTVGAITSNSFSTRAVILRNSVVTLLGGASAVGFVMNTGLGVLTISAASATIVYAASSSPRPFQGSGAVYGTLTYTAANSPGALTITGANTFDTLNVGPGRTLSLPPSTVTIVNNWNVAGTGVAYDRFDRADSTTGLGTSDSGHTWTDRYGSVWGLSSGRAYFATAPTSGFMALTTVATASADQTVSVTLTTVSSGRDSGVAMRFDPATGTCDMILAGTAGTQYLRYFSGGGSSTLLASDSVTWANGDRMTVIASGTSYTVLRNGAQVSAFTATALTGTHHGMLIYQLAGGARLDAFTIGSYTLVNSSTAGTQANLLCTGTQLFSGYLSVKDVAAGVAPPYADGGTTTNLLSANASNSESATAWINLAGMTGVSRTTAQAREGTASTSATAAAGGGTRRINATSGNAALSASTVYISRASVRFASGVPTPALSGGVTSNFYNSSNSIVGVQYSTNTILSPALDTWYDTVGMAVSPATAAKVGEFFWFPGNGTLTDGAVVYIDRCAVQPANPAYAGATSVDSGNNTGWLFTNMPVGSQLAAAWSARATIAATRDLRWKVQAAVRADRDVRWAVRGSTAAERAAVWAARKAVSAERALVWPVAKRIGRDGDMRWALRVSAPRSIELRWMLRELAHDSVDVQWQARAVAADVVAVPWALRASDGTTLSLVWNDAHAPRRLADHVTGVWASTTRLMWFDPDAGVWRVPEIREHVTGDWVITQAAE